MKLLGNNNVKYHLYIECLIIKIKIDMLKKYCYKQREIK